jgi:alanine racemase
MENSVRSSKPKYNVMEYSIGKIAEIINAQETDLRECDIRVLLVDSRSLYQPTVSLFFALQTALNDGHLYIRDLYERGVHNFVVQHAFPGMEEMQDANFLQVPNTLLALQQLVAFHRKNFNIPVVGITGSKGKTVVKEWLYYLLYDKFAIVRSPRSYNSQTGVPLSVWQLNEQTELGIFEAGISLPNEMQHLEPVIAPTVGIFTGIGEAHQENFTSQEEKCLEKLVLFEHLNCACTLVFNEDRKSVKSCMEKKGLLDKTFSWSKINENAPVYISGIEKGKENTVIIYNTKGIRQEIKIPFTDNASIENAIHCLTFMLCRFPEIKDLPERFARLEPVEMRLDVSTGIHNSVLIHDTYNSDIHSLSIALDFMSRRSADNSLKKVLILSDMLQSGINADVLYRKVAELVSNNQIRKIVGIGQNLMSHSGLFEMEKEFYPNAESFLYSGNWRSLKNAIILIKGSRQSRFERITEQLQEKTYQTVLEVNLDAIIHNLNYFRAKLKPATKIICMVKAFGYGIGSYELAKTLQERGADYLAVALADEGAELRREGITMPIMVMNPEEHALNTLLEYHLEPEIYNQNILNALIKETNRREILQYPIHIKLNTGMNRMGFDTADFPFLIETLNKQQGLAVKSIFSHLAGSDSSLLDYFTEEQINRFNRESSLLEKSLGRPVMKHILNSAGIERFPAAQMDMVRLGIGLYGISAENEKALKPVATLKTRILQIREVKKEETVGYNRNGKLTRDTMIACLPIGYADGLDRRLGNGNGHVSVGGKKCPIVGNVCMDICMIDVTEANAKEGREAIIFGDTITISDLATQLQTIPYEILTSVSPRVKRVYFKE